MLGQGARDTLHAALHAALRGACLMPVDWRASNGVVNMVYYSSTPATESLATSMQGAPRTPPPTPPSPPTPTMEEKIMDAIAAAGQPTPSDKELLEELKRCAVPGAPRPNKLYTQWLYVAFRNNMKALELQRQRLWRAEMPTAAVGISDLFCDESLRGSPPLNAPPDATQEDFNNWP
jgi:hypothetical protein